MLQQRGKLPTEDFKQKPWSKPKIYTPPMFERQMDGWACALFVAMALKACVGKKGFNEVTDRNKDQMRVEMLTSLLALP